MVDAGGYQGWGVGGAVGVVGGGVVDVGGYQRCGVSDSSAWFPGDPWCFGGTRALV